MIAPKVLTTFLFASVIAAAPAVALACSGPDPSITSAHVASATNDARDLTHYGLKVVVTNVGTAGQSGNVLQSVNVYQDGIKVNVKGIPPLKAGASYGFIQQYVRATDAGKGTTTFRFQLTMHQPAGSMANCSAANDSYVLTF